MVQISKKASTYTLIALLLAPLVGCGSDGTSTVSTGTGSGGGGSTTTTTTTATAGPSGKSVQGAVNGATVWADSLSTGTRYTIDSGTPDETATKTTTASDGSYTLPVTPSYKYAIVSQGGTDTLTGQPAATMMAPGGAKTVSPLTTLVMLDTSGKLASTLTSLLPAGANFDVDITAPGSLSPAALVFVTSINVALSSVDAAIQDAAKKGGATLSATQLNAINLTTFSQIASTFSNLSSTQLSNTADLATNLQTALTTAVTSVAANNTNITGLNVASVATAVANNSVVTAANVVGNATNTASLKDVTLDTVQTTSVPVSTSGTVTESTVISGSNKDAVTSTITSVAATASTGVTVTSTPTSYTPPTIPVVSNPTVTAYTLNIAASGSSYSVTTFTITFSDDMVSSQVGGTNYAHSVLNPASYTFGQTGCSPTSYSSTTKAVTFTCSALKPGSFSVTVGKATSTAGVWTNSSTPLGLLVDTTKNFTLPVITGSSGGNYNLF